MTSQLSLAIDMRPVPTRNGRPLVWCWGRCGGWGFREPWLADTTELPCDEPGCRRELGHDAPCKTRVK